MVITTVDLKNDSIKIEWKDTEAGTATKTVELTQAEATDTKRSLKKVQSVTDQKNMRTFSFKDE